MVVDEKASLRPNRRSIRLRGYDYSFPRMYFVTICTHQKRSMLGAVANYEFLPNDLGRIAKECWHGLPSHYVGIQLDAFVVMSNHVHGIIALTNPVGAGFKPARLSGRPTLSEIVRGFKTFSARRMNEMRRSPGASIWQRGFYEHIIRSEKSLGEIQKYVMNNPSQWQNDRENPEAKKAGGFETRPYECRGDGGSNLSPTRRNV